MDTKLILLGLKAMAKKLKFDRRKISQELECNFLGSGDNVIPIDD